MSADSNNQRGLESIFFLPQIIIIILQKPLRICRFLGSNEAMDKYFFEGYLRIDIQFVYTRT